MESEIESVGAKKVECTLLFSTSLSPVASANVLDGDQPLHLV